jgi:hypothetical protein
VKCRYHLAYSALLLGAAAPAAASDSLFTGTIGGQPVTLYLKDENAVVSGVYFYNRHGTPIRLKAAVTHSLDGGVDELDADGVPVARLKLSFNTAAFNGSWTSYRTGKVLPLTLVRTAYSVYGAEAVPVIQAASTTRYYFILPSIATGDVRAINVYSKSDGKLVQTLVPISPACERGVDTIIVEGTRLRTPPGPGCAATIFELDPSGVRYHEVR